MLFNRSRALSGILIIMAFVAATCWATPLCQSDMDNDGDGDGGDLAQAASGRAKLSYKNHN